MLTSDYLKQTTISALQVDLAKGNFTSEDLTKAYLREIETNNTKGQELRAVIDVCPKEIVLKIAREFDQERQQGRVRGMLHGIPIVVKDCIDTDPGLGMGTTAGCYALRETVSQGDAVVVRMLREAGAIILAKTNLSEFNNTKRKEVNNGLMQNGWSAVGGQTRSPLHDCDPGGSSTGSAIAVVAGFAAAAVGTEMFGSITKPSARAGIYGMKVTVGLISCEGIVSVNPQWDSLGPICKSVADMAIMLEVMVSSGLASEKGLRFTSSIDLRKQLAIKAKNPFEGLSVAVYPKGFISPARFYWDPRLVPISLALFRDGIDAMEAHGLTVKQAGIQQPSPSLWANVEKLMGTVISSRYKPALNSYLATRIGAGPRTLTEVIEWNRSHADIEMLYGQGGQEQLKQAEATDISDERPYSAANEELRELCKVFSPQAILELTGADFVASVEGSCEKNLSAVLGCPNATLPMGTIDGMPVGMYIFAREGRDDVLLRVMAAWEIMIQNKARPAVKSRDAAWTDDHQSATTELSQA